MGMGMGIGVEIWYLEIGYWGTWFESQTKL